MINRKQFRVLVWLVIGLLVLNVSALATIFLMRQNPPVPPMMEDECPKARGRHFFRMHDEMMQKEAGLNEQQMEVFRSLRNSHFGEIKKINREINQSREWQFEQLRVRNLTHVELDSISRRIGQLHQQWAISSATFLTEVGELCSPEQRDRVFDLLKKSRKHHGSKSRGAKAGSHECESVTD